jgi:gliding motility associated protien GldN
MWATRIWRVIDLREKINHPLYYPSEQIEDRKSLFNVIRYGLEKEGSLTPYSLGPTDDDDEFRYQMTQNQLDSLLNPIVTSYTIDPDTEEEIEVVSEQSIESAQITQYKLKEDWIFDKQRSQRYVRIIGISPMMEDYDDDGVKRGYKPLFWLYYPECRFVFQNHDVFNMQNNAQRRTFFDIFEKRHFSSYIVKESNVYDRSILGYAKGVQALLEADRIKQELFEIEHDLWHY